MIRGLNIQWLVQGIDADSEGRPTSGLASNRYRVLSPASWLENQQNHVSLIHVEHWQLDTAHPPDILLIGKMLPSGNPDRIRAFTSHLLHHIRAARDAGIPVIADFNDDHFQHPAMGSYWQALAALSTICVAGSDGMASLLKNQTHQPIRVIGDPIGSPFAEPKVFNAMASTSAGLLSRFIGGKKITQRCLNLAWYGNPVNWPPLQVWMDQLAPLAQKQPFRLWALSRISPAMQKYVDQFNVAHGPAALIELQEWNEQDQWDVVRDADVVLVPSDTGDPTKRVKTSNRLTDALHMGRSVLASPLPEYIPYADAAWLTDRPLHAITDMLTMPDAAMRKIVAGQQLVLQKCSPDEVAKQWLAAIQEAVHSSKAASRVPETNVVDVKPIRLNLGCGDKILPDYVNVDMADNWSKKQPDIIADITKKLPFDDGYADEIHAYHVLEHIQRWMVSDCLSEWLRVLKPGGKLILEMPCLDKILDIYFDSRRNESEPNPRLTILGLYGDPAYGVEAMMHKWCYSYSEITAILNDLPLIRINIQKPLTHIAIRDMRVTAVKMNSV